MLSVVGDASGIRAVDEYGAVVAQIRALTDIRFKLLGLLPLGTVAAVLVSNTSAVVSSVPIAMFALVVTVCVATYNKRNDQLYDELIARAAQLERDSGLVHGSFAQRPGRWLSYGPVGVEHRWPIGLVYASTVALWACVL